MSSMSVRSRSTNARSMTKAALMSDTRSGTSVMVAVRTLSALCMDDEALSVGAVPHRRTRPGLRRNLLAVLRRRRRGHRADEAAGDVGHFVNGAIERLFVRLRRCGESAQLADELQRRCADLLVGRGRIEVEQCFDVSTHCCLELSAYFFSTGGGAPPPPRAFADASPRIRSPRLSMA